MIERQGRYISNQLYRLLIMTFLFVLNAGVSSGCQAEPAVEPLLTPPPTVAAAAESVAVATTTAAPVVATAVPAPTVITPPTLTPIPSATPFIPLFANPVNEKMAAQAAANGVPFISLSMENSGLWQFDPGQFIHPIDIDVRGRTVYLLDAGRVLRLDLAAPAPPQRLLAPGDYVAGVRVLEPLALAAAEDGLLVLDRSSDLYRLPYGETEWLLERYDRPVGQTSSHYYIALDAAGTERTMLEASYRYVMILTAAGDEQLWPYPDEVYGIDAVTNGQSTYLLTQGLDGSGAVVKYENTALVSRFAPTTPIVRPRQLAAVDGKVYLLDEGGVRLQVLDGRDGRLLELLQLPTGDPVSAFWAGSDGALWLAARDRIYFYGRLPDGPNQERLYIPGGVPLPAAQPHDPQLLQHIQFALPIMGTDITPREIQFPGAPRHYRLGVHQGLDFYWQPGTRIFAPADGVVVRAEANYIPPAPWEFAANRAKIFELGYSSEETIDFYRGRQIWIEHAGGLVTRYVHLSAVAPGIVEGETVRQGQLLGAVGNSGSPASLVSDSEDAHLHFEIWIGDHYIGQFLRPVEIREWVAYFFGK